MTTPRVITTFITPSPVHPHIYGDRRECYPADMLAKRRAAFVAQVQELPAETLRRIAAAVGVPAEIATDGELAYRFDPDAVDTPTPEVTEEMDLRNSREFPF
jgi:hypothetical protein